MLYHILKKLKILAKRLFDDLPIQYELGDYYVTLDKVNIINKLYYLITIVDEYNKCSNCSKVFIDKVTDYIIVTTGERFINGEMPNLRTESFTLIIIDVDNLKRIK